VRLQRVEFPGLFVVCVRSPWSHAHIAVVHRRDVHFLDRVGLVKPRPCNDHSLPWLLFDQQQDDRLQHHQDVDGNEFMVLHLVPPLPHQRRS